MQGRRMKMEIKGQKPSLFPDPILIVTTITASHFD